MCLTGGKKLIVFQNASVVCAIKYCEQIADLTVTKNKTH